MIPDRIERTCTALTQNRFVPHYFQTKEEALAYLLQEIQNKTVGLGDSRTLWDMGVYDALCEKNDVADPMHRGDRTFKEEGKRALCRDVFITSVNAMTETGVLVNIDGTGNRVAGSLFGADVVYFVVGVNKLVPTVDEAITRARTIAAPLNADRKSLHTPCAMLHDTCHDCSSPDRICNALVVYYKKMRNVERMEVLLINESLGF